MLFRKREEEIADAVFVQKLKHITKNYTYMYIHTYYLYVHKYVHTSIHPKSIRTFKQLYPKNFCKPLQSKKGGVKG